MTDHVLADRYAIAGKVALVTGGGAGIGRATARLLGALGATVVVMDRDHALADETVAMLTEAGGQGLALAVDVGDGTGLEAAFETIAAEVGPPQIVVNNAGMAIRAKATEISEADWNQVLSVNLTGMFTVARLAARMMTPNGGGVIVNTASIMGLSGGLYPNVAYQTTKGGVVNMTRALALEWAADGIRVNAIAPTYVNTGFITALTSNPETLKTITDATPLGRLAEPEEIADAIVFLASGAAAMITGTILPIDGGYLAR
ncbi:SDR family NAD(P)-dependent oxidoreductase [Devosia sp.]|uniref:SDR family NAD(P)-dependent oxidoreductase n=1 Tax=Devosia sp. TaxID=1871048 RepID=UPI003A9201C4